MSHLETASQGKFFLKLSPQEQEQQQQQQQLLPFYDLLPQVKISRKFFTSAMAQW